jgi:hypothetical protein
MGVQADIAAFNSKVGKLARQQVKVIGFHITNQAVQMTPVDTGRLRAGWITDTGDLPNGEVFVDIKNPVEYAIYVEEGTDKMRPVRMLGRAIENASKLL